MRLVISSSSETPDALFIQDRKHDLLVVGDAFMPYIGAPFVAEGSPEGFLGAIDLVLHRPHATEAQIRKGLEGNICRCTGYHNIVKAVQQAAQAMGR